jgi:hypothetical protein
MKTKKLLWAALSMTAALMMTACSSDDNDTTEAPVAPSTTKTIPYTVTVGGDEATIRATVDSDNKTLRFATGDKLYIWGENIKGVLDITDGVGSTDNATFSGELTYSGSGSPASNLALTATLVSAQQTVGTEVSVDAAGAVTVNYPTTAYCADVATAVQKYSRLTDTSTYGARAFSLTQQTAFLNFVITFTDGTTSGTELSAVVNNSGSPLCTANVTTVTDGGVKAKFVLPVASSTTLSGATVQMGDKEALSIDNATLKGKVYNVTRTQAAAAAEGRALSASEVGDIVGSDGLAYAVADKDNLPSDVTAVAMVAYKSGSNGLAIQLNANPASMGWESAKAYTGYPAVSGGVGTWRLPSKEEWQNMFVGCKIDGDATEPNDNNKMDPIAGFREKIAATGTVWMSDKYWSSTPSGSVAWRVSVTLGDRRAMAVFNVVEYTSQAHKVLGCLAF